MKTVSPITLLVSCCREHLGTCRAHCCTWSMSNTPVCSGGWGSTQSSCPSCQTGSGSSLSNLLGLRIEVWMNTSETHPSTKDIFRLVFRAFDLWHSARSKTSLFWKTERKCPDGSRVAELTIAGAIMCAKGQWLVIISEWMRLVSCFIG